LDLSCVQVYKWKKKHVHKDKNPLFSLKIHVPSFLPWLKNSFQKTLYVIWTIMILIQTYKRLWWVFKKFFLKSWTFRDICVFACVWELKHSKISSMLSKSFNLCETMTPKRSKIVVIPGINTKEEANNVWPLDSLILGWWVITQNLEEEGFPIKGLLDCVGWAVFLEKLNSWHYGPYALFRECKVEWCQHQRHRQREGNSDLASNHRCCVWMCWRRSGFWQGLKKEITQKIMDIILYGSPWLVTDDKKTMINFLRTANLTYMCRLIHNFLFNMVISRLGSWEGESACTRSW